MSASRTVITLVAGQPRVWVRARYASTLDRDWCALYHVGISGEVE